MLSERAFVSTAISACEHSEVRDAHINRVCERPTTVPQLNAYQGCLGRTFFSLLHLLRRKLERVSCMLHVKLQARRTFFVCCTAAETYLATASCASALAWHARGGRVACAGGAYC